MSRCCCVVTALVAIILLSAGCTAQRSKLFGPLLRGPAGDASTESEQGLTSGTRAACGSSPSCLAACYLENNCGGSSGTSSGSLAGTEGEPSAPAPLTSPVRKVPGMAQFVSGDGSQYFASAEASKNTSGSGAWAALLAAVATTCYATVHGQTREYNATIDASGNINCSAPLRAVAPGQAGTEGVGAATVRGALLPERKLNPAFGGLKSASSDNPGRTPGQYAEAMANLMAVNNPGLMLQMRQLAAEATLYFLKGTAAPLPRSLDRRPRLLSAPGIGPDFYSSTLGGAGLMLQLLKLYQADPVASSFYLGGAIAFASTMMQYGTDRYGTVHSPLFASVLIIQAEPILPPYVELQQWPPHTGIFRPINFPNIYPGINGTGPQGQVYWGANVAADQDLYSLLYLLTSITGNSSYSDAADAALKFFAGNCLVPESNLFAWGAHAQWDFYNDTWARGVVGYNGTACCPQAYWLHSPIPVPDHLLDKLFALDASAMQSYTKGLVQASVVNIGAPAFFAYDTNGALWATPRAAAVPLEPSTLRLESLTQTSATGGLLLYWGALGLARSVDSTYLSMMEQIWVAFVIGIRGQKTRFLTSYYPDGNFYMNGTLGPGGFWLPPVPIQAYAAKAAALLPASGPGSSYRAALMSLVQGLAI